MLILPPRNRPVGNTLGILLPVLASLLVLIVAAPGRSERPDVVEAKTAGREVGASTMQQVYDEVKTPFKHGVVLREPGKMVHCPAVFRHGKRWYMTYIVFDGDGYETWIAASDDLLVWEKLGRVLPFTEGTWDAVHI